MKRIAIVLAPLLVAGVAVAGSTPTSTTPAPPPASTTAPATAVVPKPEDVIAYRLNTMKTAGSHMRAIGMITKGQINRPQDLAPNAAALHEAAMELGDLFPAGTGPDKFPPTNDRTKVGTTAKAEVWSDPTGFKTALTAFQTETQKLVDVVGTKDAAAIKVQYTKVGDTCGDCHDKFRVKD